MVSLIDNSTQYILAEATQSISLIDPTRHAPGDHIWLGQVSAPRKDCVDEHVFGAQWLGQDSEGNDRALRALVINDLSKDDRFRQRPYVNTESGVKFYAGVPIITKQGYEIGVYAVSGPEPRATGLNLDEVLFMQDAAHIVAEHLERVKITVDGERDEVFVKSMHNFIEGLSNVKHDLDRPVRDPRGSGSEAVSDTRATDAQAEHPQERRHSSQEQECAQDESEKDSRQQERTKPEPEDVQPKYSTETTPSAKDNTDPAASNIKMVFQRAASCLRDALDAQACVFLDASSGLFTPTGANSRSASEGPRTISAGEFDSNDDGDSSDELEKDAVVLGMATAEETHLPLRGVIKRKHLKTFLMRYPYGQAFYLDDGHIHLAESVDLSDTIVGRGTQRNRGRRRLEQHMYHSHLPQQLLDQLHDVKWLIFLPLFNFAHGQWATGGFMWSTEDKTRDLKAAMPYLKTFGSCLMSEITSMEAFNTSMAKSTFIASMSHDLRSPLHGMLGSLEFLEDTVTSSYQLSLLGSIETCGKTLLDTIDHLLDYAKINNLNRSLADEPAFRNGQATPIARDKSPSNIVAFDMALLLEEVVEAVFAGQTFRKIKLRGHDPVNEAAHRIQSIGIDDSQSTEEQIHGGSAKFSGKVFFILDIQKAESWCMRSQTGALRRIIMNVVGNAIKYCVHGSIEIILNLEQKENEQAEVKVSVKDSGIGMSQAFLENHLFKAFSQEDPFAPGAGLGLSIASQIVENLHGKIRIQSEKEVGTHALIILPMQMSGDSGEDQDLLNSAERAASGKSICLLNPHADTSDMSEGQLPRLTASIARTFEEWFHMKAYQARTVNDDRETSIFVYCEPPPIEYLLKHHSERRAFGKGGREAALLIICTNAFEAAALRAAGVSKLINLGRIIEVISQPVGPRKLAKVLLQSMQRVENSATDDDMHQTVAQQPGPKDDALASGEAEQRAQDIEWTSNSVVYEDAEGRHRPSMAPYRWKSDVPIHAKQSATPPLEGQSNFGDIKAGRIPGLEHMPHKDVADGVDAARLPSVLVVDDNHINLKLLVTFMKKIKLPYAEAMNGLEAFEKFKEADKTFDYVLLDLQMPIMDGLESCRKMREYEKQVGTTKPATIIAITGVGSDSVRKEAMDAGMNQYLTKPVRFKALQVLLEQNRE